MSLSKTHQRYLEILDQYDIDVMGRKVFRLQERVLNDMQLAGFCRYYPYGKPPSWKITKEGREALFAQWGKQPVGGVL